MAASPVPGVGSCAAGGPTPAAGCGMVSVQPHRRTRGSAGPLQPSAVDHDPLRGDELGGIGHEEPHGRGHVLGLAQAAEGEAGLSSWISVTPMPLAMRRPRSVLARPGTTMLTRIPLPASSLARVRASASCAALAML